MLLNHTSPNKKNSAQMVIDVIRWNYPISRIDISGKTDLSIASVSRVVSKLIKDAYIEEIDGDSDQGGMGRKTLMLTLKPNQMLTAGAEYDGEILKISILDEKGIPLISKETLMSQASSPMEIATYIYEQIGKLILESNQNIKLLYGIGIGFPGIIDHINGEIIFSSQLGWKHVPFKKLMENISGKPCFIENDLKANIYGEYIYGVAKGSQLAVILSFGSGLGSAAIIDGKLLRGVTNSAGEIGHITQNINGSICSCGKIGCLQTNIAKPFLLDEAKTVSNIENLDEFMSAVMQNEVWARRLAEKFITHAAIAIDTALCAYNPDTVILCGELVEQYPYIFNEIRREFYNKYLWDYLKDTFTLHQSTYRGLGCSIGVAALIQNLYYQLR